MNVLARQILLTLSYTAQFSYPLRAEEIWIRLILPSEKQTFSKTEFELMLQLLVSRGIVETTHGFYFLDGQKSTVQQRLHNQLSTQRKYQEFQPVVTFARWLPWVLGVAVTGSAAVGNARPEDDTDVLLVIQDNRLWLVRPLFIFFAYLYGKRRSWQKEEANSWCFNLWLESSALAQPQATYSLYAAYEVCQTDWLVSKNECKELFFRENSWVKQYIPHFFEVSRNTKATDAFSKIFQRFPLVSEIFDVLNFVLYALQYQYMRSHMTRERVQLNAAFFHPRDTRKMITSKLQDQITRL